MKKLALAAIAVIMGGFVAFAPIVSSTPAYAEDKCVLTSILGNAKCDKDGNRNDSNGTYNCSCDNGQGSSVTDTLTLVLDILTGLVGIVAVIGITVVGIQYLTAGGSEEKTRKSKRRLFEIVLGVVAYVAIYILLKWLLPGWNLG